jgi:ethanolamine transporter EutH
MVLFRGVDMNLQGVIIGLAAFLIIGIFHPIVIKSEYYVGKKVWPLFLIFGLLLIVISIYIKSLAISAIVAITGFSSLWSIHEIFEQEERVKKGWFPHNPNKKK